jgi:Zn-finger nucleic acid-binding protein
MNCPVCNHSLEAEKYQYLPYLCCKQCGGMWVDSKMLKHLATRLAAEKGIKPAKPVSFSPLKALRTPQSISRKKQPERWGILTTIFGVRKFGWETKR